MEIQKYIEIQWGSPGHDSEYILLIRTDEKFSLLDVPEEWQEQLIGLLGQGWNVHDRVDRLEVFPPNLLRSDRTDNVLSTAILQLIGQEYELSPIISSTR